MTTLPYRYPSIDDEPVWARRGASNDTGGRDFGTTSRHHTPPYNYHPPPPQGPLMQQQPHTTVVHSSAKPMPDSDIYKVGLYGWRKRCLYVFILLLTVVIVVNLAITLWIMTVLDFSTDGIGALKIDRDGIRVEGRAEFAKPVQFSQLSTNEDQALSIDSTQGVSLNAHNFSGYTTASLSMSPDGKVGAVCERFEVLNKDRKLLFFVDSQEVGLKLENLRILDDGGSVFEGAIQTALIRPEADSPLSLESPTRSMVVEAGQDIELMSGAGEIQLTSLLDITLKSKQGDIRLESGSIYLSGLERSNAGGGGGGQVRSQYQLCVCHNGRLFMAGERADCRADRGICD